MIKATVKNCVDKNVSDARHGAKHVGFCITCKEAIKGERKTKKFCGNACRQKYFRQKSLPIY
jgi:hypothetical protein